MVAPTASFVSRGDRGSCDGVSIIDSGLILFRPTPSRRQNFTLTHELAHHLVAADVDCLSWLADQSEPGRLLEQLCDQMAAEFLVSEQLVVQAIGEGPPDANALLALFEASEASRSVCAVAFASKLPCDGFVVLVEEGAHTVFFAARARDTRPYAWRGDELPPAHPLRRDPPPTKMRTWWPQPGWRRPSAVLHVLHDIAGVELRGLRRGQSLRRTWVPPPRGDRGRSRVRR